VFLCKSLGKQRHIAEMYASSGFKMYKISIRNMILSQKLLKLPSVRYDGRNSVVKLFGTMQPCS
jgi:hypothetical protein